MVYNISVYKTQCAQHYSANIGLPATLSKSQAHYNSILPLTSQFCAFTVYKSAHVKVLRWFNMYLVDIINIVVEFILISSSTTILTIMIHIPTM